MKSWKTSLLVPLFAFAATTLADGTGAQAKRPVQEEPSMEECLEQAAWCEARAAERMAKLEARRDGMDLARYVRAEKRIRAQKEDCMRDAMEPCEG